MKVLLAASEMSPFAKTGGLGDVIGSLPAALAELGHEVTCCLPYYRCVRQVAANAKPMGLNLNIPLGHRTVSGDVLELQLQQRVRVLFVRRDEFFDRSELYHTGIRDYEDNAERFLFFSKAVVELLGYTKFQTDIVHCHDWQTAFVPVLATYLRQTRGPLFAVKSVFTIHNIAYQGMFWSLDFPLTNLPGEFFTPAALEYYGQLNLMKGGILFSDAVTTVSKKYAAEIRTPELGFGLDAVLRARDDDLHGILNGVDYARWDPATDPLLVKNYSVSDLAGKRACRAELVKRLGLDVAADKPVAAYISRLTEQKGVEVFAGAVEALVGLGLAIVILGKGERRHEEALSELAGKFPKRVCAIIRHDEELSHQIQGGADLLLMPSQFEPCGLTQMYALKYGTIPVVRATGGLDDTVSQYDDKTGAGTGFKFVQYSSAALVEAVKRAVVLYKQPKKWQGLMRNAMACDFSWKASAKEYENLYASLLS